MNTKTHKSMNIDELEWGKISDAQRRYAASRSTYNNWISTRQVVSKRVGGARYVYIPSVRELFEGAPAKPSATTSRRMRQLGHLSAQARAAAKT